jgi:hypothetical protein
MSSFYPTLCDSEYIYHRVAIPQSAHFMFGFRASALIAGEFRGSTGGFNV